AYASRDISLSAAQAYRLDPARTLADTLRGARAGPRNRAVAAHEGCKCAQRRGGAERPFNRASGTTIPGRPIPGAAMKSHHCSLISLWPNESISIVLVAPPPIGLELTYYP